MIKIWLMGFWICAVTAGSTYGAIVWKTQQKANEDVPEARMERIETKTLTVPVIAGGNIDGYVVARFAYAVDRNKTKQDTAGIELVLSDESFRTIYAGDAMKFKKPRRNDVTEMTNLLKERTNARLGPDAISDVLVRELSFIPKDQVRGGGNKAQ